MDYALQNYDPLFTGCVHNCLYDAHLEPTLLHHAVNLKDVPAQGWLVFRSVRRVCMFTILLAHALVGKDDGLVAQQTSPNWGKNK